MSLTTITLYDYFQSELIKKGFNEIEDEEGKLIYFEKEHQFIHKILSYDKDVKEILDELFYNHSLSELDHDQHFKKIFLYRFINRQINRQTIESFQLELLNTFLTNQDFINRVYQDLEKYLTNTSDSNQSNQQKNLGTTTTDNRSANQDLAQNQVNLDINDSTMDYATDNQISRNKQTNQQDNDGTTTTENKSYQLDTLLKSNGLMEEILNNFDRKCFLQIW